MVGIEAGTVVAGKYRLLELLGEGAMGSVWAAEHVELESRVAIKFIQQSLVQHGASIIQRFQREARAAAKIDSLHVVQVTDLGKLEDGTPYLVMELLLGESLEARLERAGPLPLRKAGSLVAQVAEVLAKAHAASIVHRDIKPANIFLVQSSYEIFAKVLDFGVARMVEESHRSGGKLTTAGMVIGTPEYMSPEQINGEPVDHQADLWALAVLAYRALTGEQPFIGRTLAALSVAITRGHFLPASTACPSVPPGLDDWFARAFRTDRAERFASADAMAEAFVNAILLATSLSIEDEDTVSAFRKLERRSLPERADAAADASPPSGAGNTRRGLGAALMGAPAPLSESRAGGARGGGKDRAKRGRPWPICPAAPRRYPCRRSRLRPRRVSGPSCSPVSPAPRSPSSRRLAIAS